MGQIIDLLDILFSNRKKENLKMGYIKSNLTKHDYEVNLKGVIIDRKYHLSDIFEGREPELVGISMDSNDAKEVLQLVADIKLNYPKVFITLCGEQVITAATDILKEVTDIDAICIGEAEETFVELADRVFHKFSLKDCKGIIYKDQQKIIENPRRNVVQDLDLLPFPARDVYEQYPTPFMNIVGGRGCTGHCTFCEDLALREVTCKNVRVRSPKNIVDEIEYLYTKYKMNTFHFTDPTFEDPGEIGKNKAFGVYQEIIKRKLKLRLIIYSRAEVVVQYNQKYIDAAKQAGVESIFFGN